jgi:glutathionylspermidine synthase
MDLAYGEDKPKLLEINGDTPTSLYEAGVVQWEWLKDTGGSDQFNMIHDSLINVLSRLSMYEKTRVHEDGGLSPLLHTVCVSPHYEDEGTVWYLRYLAEEQGLSAKFTPIHEIGWNSGAAGLKDRFVDQSGLDIKLMFKLYPWEWLLSDEFGARLIGEVMAGHIRLIEPAWKMVLSNKHLLTSMWERYPYHPNLLQTSNENVFRDDKFVKKPVLGREGQGVKIVDRGAIVAQSTDNFENGDYVYQAYTPLMEGHGNFAVIGSWMIDGIAAGIGIRESRGLITNNMGRFVPHVFE